MILSLRSVTHFLPQIPLDKASYMAKYDINWEGVDNLPQEREIYSLNRSTIWPKFKQELS